MLFLQIWKYYMKHYYCASYNRDDIVALAQKMNRPYLKPIFCSSINDALELVQYYSHLNQLKVPDNLLIQKIVELQRLHIAQENISISFQPTDIHTFSEGTETV